MEALLPSWIIYPLITKHVMASFSRRPIGHILAFGTVLWLASIGPTLALMAWNHSWLSWKQVQLTWFWPGAQLPDFALGACVALLVQRCPPPPLAGYLADLALAALILACLLVPVPTVPFDWDGPRNWRPGHYMRWEQLSARSSAPLIAAFLYFSSGEGSSSLAVRILSHPALVALGAYTLEVYLFQAPLHDAFLELKTSGGVWRGLPEGPEVYVAYLLALWLIAGVFVESVAEPLRRLVQACFCAPDGRGVPPHWSLFSSGYANVPVTSEGSELSRCSAA